MILSCSSCGAKYLVDIHQIKYGRHVKCFRCGHVWYHENKSYNPDVDDQIKDNNHQTTIETINDDSNLPVIYKKKKTIPLPFILLIFLVIFYTAHLMSENIIQINTVEFSKDLNQLIDSFVKKIYYFFTNYFFTD